MTQENPSKSFGYSIVPAENRPSLLITLLSKYWNAWDQCWTRKVVVVFSHSNCVKFYSELGQWQKKLPIMPFMRRDLHTTDGKQMYAVFNEAETALMAVTSDTAEHLTDLSVETVIQYDPPPTDLMVKQLTSCCNNYLLFLRPQELSYVEHLKDNCGVVLEERAVPWGKIPPLPAVKLQDWYKTTHSANINSKGTYKAYLDALKNHAQQQFFNIKDVTLKEVSTSLCLPIPPFYKLIDTVNRYQENLERKRKRAEEPLPENAKVIKTTYKRIPRSHDAEFETFKFSKTSTDKKLAKSKKNAKKVKQISTSVESIDEENVKSKVSKVNKEDKARKISKTKQNVEEKGEKISKTKKKDNLKMSATKESSGLKTKKVKKVLGASNTDEVDTTEVANKPKSKKIKTLKVAKKVQSNDYTEKEDKPKPKKIKTTEYQKAGKILATLPKKDRPLTAKDKPAKKVKREPLQNPLARKWVSRRLPLHASIYDPEHDAPSLHAPLGLPYHLDFVEVANENGKV